MNLDFFSNTIGYLGNTSYSLKYIAYTRNLRCTWPHNNVLARSQDGNSLIQSVLRQPVGIDRSHAYQDKCSELELILSQFWIKHRKTDYAELLDKCDIHKSNNNTVQPVRRYVIKEFVHKLIRNVIPLSLFGNEGERRVFEQNVRKILYLGKGQVFSLNMLVQRVRTKNKTYLKSLSGNIDKTNLLAKLYLWLLRCYIFAALKCVFYITDCNQSKKYSFYKKRTWQGIQERAFNRMRKQILGTYRNCLITRAVKSYNLYVLRILPKRRGSRPIYLKWKKELKKPLSQVPLVQIVKHFFLQLAEENFVYTQNTTASNFHQKWENLYFSWATSAKPQVYFVKVDFRDAYGSILHTKLLESVNELVNKNPDKKDIIFSFRKRTIRAPVSYVLGVIREYVTNFAYKHNANVYRLTEGISQGGPLSSLLCNFYFGEVDLKYLSEFGRDECGFLVRNCDDYLYVTLDLIKALKFLDRIADGFPDYNLKLNDAKTETNIFSKANEGHHVRILSYELDVNSFQLYRCFQPYKNSSIFHTSFFKTIKYPGQILAKRILLWATSKLDQVYFDTLYNTVHTILYNVFQTASLTAARFVSYIRVLFGHYNQSFILRCILRVSVRIACRVSKIVSFRDNVSNALLMWIVLKAFLLRLQSTENRNRYSTVLRRTNSILSTWLTKFNEAEIQILETLCSDNRTSTLGFII